jgi:hypothetical protein
MERYTRAGPLKRGILLFWAAWVSIIVVMNGCDLLRAAGVLSREWRLASGNYAAIVKVSGVYGTPHWIDWLLLLGITMWEGGAAWLFWRAFRRYHAGRQDRWPAVYLAFTVLLAVFCMFMVGDEVFHAYGMEGDHRGISVLLLTSLMAMHVLPDRAERG